MPAINHSIEMDSFLHTQKEASNRDLVGSSSSSNDKARTSQRNYAIGIGLILIVASLWTLSSFVTQVSSSFSPTVWKHLHFCHRTCMEVATINRSCMPESFILYFFPGLLNPNCQGHLYEYQHALAVPNSFFPSTLVET